MQLNSVGPGEEIIGFVIRENSMSNPNMGSWEAYLIPRSLDFLPYKMGIISIS